LPDLYQGTFKLKMENLLLYDWLGFGNVTFSASKIKNKDWKNFTLLKTLSSRV
jgi:hypothetical protein